MLRTCSAIFAAALLVAAAGAASARAEGAAAVSIAAMESVSFPFWCDWGYDWDERCYRDRSERVPIGGDDGKVWRAGIRFALDAVPRGAVVLEARLHVYYDGVCIAPRGGSAPCDGRGYVLDAYQITSTSWYSEREVEFDWLLDRFDLAPFARPQWMSWDVTDLVGEWVTYGVPNYGLLLKLADAQEDFGVGGPRVPAATYRTAALRPRLDIAYIDDG